MISLEDHLLEAINDLGFDLNTFLRPQIDDIFDSNELSYEVRKLVVDKLRKAEHSVLGIERLAVDRFTFTDLFAGIGGFRLGLESLGGRCLAFSEIDKNSIKTYKENFDTSGEDELGDIRSVSDLKERPDLLVGGVPCQSWSIAGKNRGFDDPRGELWGDAVRVLTLNQPKAFIFENVKGLADPRNNREREHLLKCFKDAGYWTWVGVLDSIHFGVPQSRKRIYFIGFKDKKQFVAFSNAFRSVNKIEYVPRSLATPKRALSKILVNLDTKELQSSFSSQTELFTDVKGPTVTTTRITEGAFDYFIFNDIRNGGATIHSWDLVDLPVFDKELCLTILENRRSRRYGPRDGNPLSFKHISALLDMAPPLIEESLDNLVANKVLLKVLYDVGREIKIKPDEEADSPGPVEWRYEFANSRISSGIRVSDYLPGLPKEDIIYRIFMPDALAFGTLTASGSNDFVALHPVNTVSSKEAKKQFVEKILRKRNYRKLTKREYARLQGFPDTFKLHETDATSNKQMGNAVTVPVIQAIGKRILEVLEMSKNNIINDEVLL